MCTSQVLSAARREDNSVAVLVMIRIVIGWHFVRYVSPLDLLIESATCSRLRVLLELSWYPPTLRGVCSLKWVVLWAQFYREAKGRALYQNWAWWEEQQDGILGSEPEHSLVDLWRSRSTTRPVIVGSRQHNTARAPFLCWCSRACSPWEQPWTELAIAWGMTCYVLHVRAPAGPQWGINGQVAIICLPSILSS